MAEDNTAPRDSGEYHVVLLVEQALTTADAAQVHSLHEGLDGPVTYHVLMPLEDAAARIEASMGTLNAGDMMASPTMPMSEVDLDAVRKDCADRSEVRARGHARGAEPQRRHRCRPGRLRPADRRPHREARRGRRQRGDHPDPTARRGRVLPPRLDLQGTPTPRRPDPAPARAGELRRAGRGLRRGHHGPLLRAVPEPSERQRVPARADGRDLDPARVEVVVGLVAADDRDLEPRLRESLGQPLTPLHDRHGVVERGVQVEVVELVEPTGAGRRRRGPGRDRRPGTDAPGRSRRSAR